MTTTFTALDFETANYARNSVCQTGIVRVEDGKVVEQKSWLNQPPNNYYVGWFTSDIHGISPHDTAGLPTFDQVWADIKPFIAGHHVVAHNSAFDFPCLRATLAHYGLETPAFHGHCTYRLLKASLKALCARYHIALNHHNALSDALACAHLFMIAQGGKLA